MTREALYWLVGGVASLVFHLGLSSMLEISVEPDPVAKQDLPEARLEMSAYEVQRSEVREERVESEQVMPGQAQQTALSQGAIPRVAAIPQTPKSTVAPAAPLQADILQATASPTSAAVLASLPTQASTVSTARPETAVSATRPDAAVVTAARPPASRIAGAALFSEPATQSQAPRSSRVAAAEPKAAAIAAAPFGGATLDSATPQAVSLIGARVAAAWVAAARPDQTTIEPAPAAATPAAPVQAEASLLADIGGQQFAPVLVASLAPGLLASIERPQASILSDVQPDTGDPLPAFRPASPQSAAIDTAGAPLASGPLPSAATETRPAPSQPAREDDPATFSQDLPPQTPQSDFATASLAWTGGAKASFDPASLAAIQSFMTESDLSSSQSNAGSVRDGIAALLSQVPCSRLQVAFVPGTGSLELRGHVPEEGLRLPVLAALQARMGASIPVIDNLLILPRPQCGALSRIGSVGLPQSTDQLTNPLLVGADAQAKLYRYTEGDRLTFDLTAPDYDAFVYVDYFDANGMVIHLVPNATVRLENRTAKSNVPIGADRADGNFLKVTIGPPYGQEIAVAFAASEPLYEGVRPTVEPADAYLDWLRDQVTRARATYSDFKGEWVYFFVTTSQGG